MYQQEEQRPLILFSIPIGGIFYILVLVLASTELIFLLVSGIVLCFEFRMRTMLISHLCFNYCRAGLTLSQRLVSFSVCPASRQAGDEAGLYP